MKSSAAVALGLLYTSSLLTVSCYAYNANVPAKRGEVIRTRRTILADSAKLVFVTLASTSSGASMAQASLLDEYGADPNKVVQKKEEIEVKAEGVAKTESIIEPNLRSNYYYPTNKKRYLPRIKKCNDAIPDAAESIGNENWEAAAEFVNKVADDTVLPLKLYTSSLSGGGTNVKVSFTKDMEKAAKEFEKAQKALVKAVGKKDRSGSSKALEDLSEALQAYREAGRLTGPDAGGDIPSVDEIRRSACRVQGRSFEKKVKERDARLAEERSKMNSS